MRKGKIKLMKKLGKLLTREEKIILFFNSKMKKRGNNS